MKIAERCCILLVALLWSNLVSFGQIDLLVVVTDGQVSTTCDDIFSGPDPHYEVTIGNTSIVYPEDGNCYQNPPFLNYSESFICPADLPATLTVCLDVFENDGLLFCNVNKACLVTICQEIRKVHKNMRPKSRFLRKSLDITRSQDPSFYGWP